MSPPHPGGANHASDTAPEEPDRRGQVGQVATQLNPPRASAEGVQETAEGRIVFKEPLQRLPFQLPQHPVLPTQAILERQNPQHQQPPNRVALITRNLSREVSCVPIQPSSST